MPKHPPLGFTFAGVPCGLKKTGAADFALIASDRPCAAAAVFTRNKFAAAPVIYDRALVTENPAGLAAVAINSGCANACTGDAGLADATAMAAEVEAALGLPARSCAVMSTGVIGVRLDMSKIAAGVRLAAPQLAAEGWDAASRAIMTTDTRPKVAFREVGGVRLFGMAKGAGMIHPNMATMLSTIVTDAAIEPAALAALLREAVEVSFNSVTVDGDTSTNDTVLVLANGASGVTVSGGMGEGRTGNGNGRMLPLSRSPTLPLSPTSISPRRSPRSAPISRSRSRAMAKARRSSSPCGWRARRATPMRGLRPSRSPTRRWSRPRSTVATPIGGASCARWATPPRRSIRRGRICGSRRDVGNGEWEERERGRRENAPARPLAHPPTLQLVPAGQPLAYSEEAASAIFAEKEIVVEVKLGLGDGQATVWTCDLSHEYVDINGHYRT